MKNRPFRLFWLIWILAALIPASQAQEPPTPPSLPVTLSPGRGGAFALQWRPDGEVLVISGSKGLWFLDKTFNFIGHTNKFGASGQIEWSPDGQYLATSHSHNDKAFVIIWHSESDGHLVDIKRFDVSAYSMVWHPFKRIISIGGEIIDLSTDERLTPFQIQVVNWMDGSIFEIRQAGLVNAWSPDAQQVVHLSQVGGSSHAIYGVFDAQTGELFLSLKVISRAEIFSDGVLTTKKSLRHTASGMHRPAETWGNEVPRKIIFTFLTRKIL
jgi:WD40 repeat protein